MKPDVLAVVGAQFGSEGKGVIVNRIADRYKIHVRVGGPNAGHSFYHKGNLYKMQVVPCGWTNPDALLVLGRGALINVEKLVEEIETIRLVDPKITERVFIDDKAGHLSPSFEAQEGGVDGEAHRRIGSTGKGVGPAREARIQRDPAWFSLMRDADVPDMVKSMLCPDTDELLQDEMSDGNNVLLEGTQGAGLSLIHGPWPYVTSADTNSGQFSADLGLPPRFINRCLLVARTYPIRVAGNSGPMFNEISWEEISDKMGRPTEERTTVTNKVRRIGLWDPNMFRRACRWNAPTSVALTFMDYFSRLDEGKTSYDDLTDDAKKFTRYVEGQAGAPVSLVGTGGEDWKVIDREIPL